MKYTLIYIFTSFYILIFTSGCSKTEVVNPINLEEIKEKRENIIKKILTDSIDDSKLNEIILTINSESKSNLEKISKDKIIEIDKDLNLDIEKISKAKREISEFNIFDTLLFFVVDFLVYELIIFFCLFIVSLTASSSKLWEAYLSISGLISIIILGIILSFFFDFGSFFFPSSKDDLIENFVKEFNDPYMDKLKDLSL